MLNTSAIILANETPKRFPQDKGTTLLNNKTIIQHVFDAINPIVDEVIIVTNTKERAEEYAKFLPKTTKFTIDTQQTPNLLSGTIAGFETAQGQYTLLIPYDVPLINRELAKFLLDLSIGKMAAVPRTPDNEIEPLCAAYQTKAVLEIAKQTTTPQEEITTDLLYELVEKLRGVRYISMSVIKQIDPDLHSFFSINTPLDLKRATVMLQGKQKQRLIKHKKR
ncbi:MAG: NTP transferase domain-containing protein [Candidatus Bathyarchaeota archaeon]|nr:NTP transferase domain-containing protein [Candidatus Termiticorpusculum sp.]